MESLLSTEKSANSLEYQQIPFNCIRTACIMYTGYIIELYSLKNIFIVSEMSLLCLDYYVLSFQ